MEREVSTNIFIVRTNNYSRNTFQTVMHTVVLSSTDENGFDLDWVGYLGLLISEITLRNTHLDPAKNTASITLYGICLAFWLWRAWSHIYGRL
jgi:hypothetical protein